MKTKLATLISNFVGDTKSAAPLYQLSVITSGLFFGMGNKILDKQYSLPIDFLVITLCIPITSIIAWYFSRVIQNKLFTTLDNITEETRIIELQLEENKIILLSAMNKRVADVQGDMPREMYEVFIKMDSMHRTEFLRYLSRDGVIKY